MSKRPHQLALIVKGKVRLVTDPETGETEPFVYQRVAAPYGNVSIGGRHTLQLRRHVVPTDARTEAQLKNRARIQAATAAWQDEPEHVKDEYRERARKMPRTGFQLYCKEFCRAHPVGEFTWTGKRMTNEELLEALIPYLQKLDVQLSSRAEDATALKTDLWTPARAGKLDALDKLNDTITSRAPLSTALSTAQWTNARASKLDALDKVDVLTSSRAPSTTPVSGGATISTSTSNNTYTTLASITGAGTIAALHGWGGGTSARLRITLDGINLFGDITVTTAEKSLIAAGLNFNTSLLVEGRGTAGTTAVILLLHYYRR